MDNIKESDIKYFLKNANKKQKEKFNKLYERLSNYEVEKNNFSNLRRKIEKLKGGSGKNNSVLASSVSASVSASVSSSASPAPPENKILDGNIKILWVRHCQSCSNVKNAKGWFGTRGIMSKFRQPLCTELGITQCLNFASGLNSDLEDKQVEFYSSLLPRAMLTSKLISSGIDPTKVYKEMIQPLPYISENYQPYNRSKTTTCWTHNPKNNDKKQSQSTSCPKILLTYIDKLNKSFIGGTIKEFTYIGDTSSTDPSSTDLNSPILQSVNDDCVYRIHKHKQNSPSEESPIGGVEFDISINRSKMVMYRSDDWSNFKKHILPNLSTNCINIIVVHGGILRHNILPDCKRSANILCDDKKKIEIEIKNKDTPNLQSYLIEYRSCHAINYTKKLYHLYSRALIDQEQKQLTTCNYSYGNNIKSEEEKEEEEQAAKRNASNPIGIGFGSTLRS